MLSENDYIEAITNGDDARLEQLLRSCNGDEPLVALIADRRPTNHSIGFGMTLLQLASIRAVIDLPNENGPLKGFECTALMVAAAEGFLEATACLLDLGADPLAVNSEGYTAMDFAERRFWDGQPYDCVIDLLKKM